MHQHSLKLDPRAEEISIVGDLIEECFYDIEDINSPEVQAFEKAWQGSPIELGRLTAYSYQVPDGITYQDFKLMVCYSCGQQDIFMYDDIDAIDVHDEYCISRLNNGQEIVKFYSFDFDRFTLPELPDWMVGQWHFGIGINNRNSVSDFYFSAKDVEAVARFWGLPIPYIAELKEFCTDTTKEKLFGLGFERKTLKPLKLKLYYYPNAEDDSFSFRDELTGEMGNVEFNGSKQNFMEY